jgi:nucleoside-diphosphate-sugar epimerase
MRVAVTGASGFIGSAICRAAVGMGWRVHGYGRRAVEIPGVHYRRWDLAAAPLREPSDVDVVVHTAANVSDWAAGPADVDLLHNVLATFRNTPLVHISTSSVYDPSRPTVMATEDQAPVQFYPTRYATEKAAAERRLADRADTVILRPRAVYGPGDRTVLPRLLSAVRRGTLWLPGPGTQRQSLTHIDNMTAAVLLACAATGSGVFNITDAEPVVLLDVLRELLGRRGLRARIRPLPSGPATALATTSEWAYRLVRSPTPPRLTRYALSQVAVERTLDITAARTHLGYRPIPTTLAEAGLW